MIVIFQGDFFKLNFKKTEKGGYHELRVTQENDLGVNTETFMIFDEDLVNVLSEYVKGDFITLYLNVFLKNGFLNKYVSSVLNINTDLITGEVRQQLTS